MSVFIFGVRVSWKWRRLRLRLRLPMLRMLCLQAAGITVPQEGDYALACKCQALVV